jgi:transcriptional regulator with XRE-family HTH domain
MERFNPLNYYSPYASYGAAARNARTSKNMTLQQLANKSGVNINTIHRLERDKSLDVRYWVCESLADALDMSVDEYMGHEVVNKIKQ